MAFGPIMKFNVGELTVELAPLTRDSMSEFVNNKHDGGMQRYAVTRYIGRQQAPTVDDENEWFDRVRASKDSLVWGIWVTKGENRTLIGNTSLNDIGANGHIDFMRQATSGSMIFRTEYWGRGIASAAHKARVWYAFKHLGLHRIKSAVIQENKGSRKALERSGYFFVYTERNDMYSDGNVHHLDCFECLNPIDLFWSQWWHGDRPSVSSRTARRLTQEAMQWAEENVTLV